MEATHRMVCKEADMVNPLSSMGVQVSFILVVSHFFHLVLKSLGQSGPIAQILAGLVLGPTGISNIPKVREFFFQASAADYYEILGFFLRIFFVFLIGLETDVLYMRRNLRMVMIVASGGVIFGCTLGLASSIVLYQHIDDRMSRFAFFGVIMILLSYTASPVVLRLAAELKLTTSEIGRLAISAAVLNEMSCLFVFNLVLSLTSVNAFGTGMLCIILIGGLVLLNRAIVGFLNKRNRNQKYLRNPEIFVLLSLITIASMLIELTVFNSILSCFIFGLMFPREGKTARTLLHKLTYSVHNFVLPIYFGYIGFQFDGAYLLKWKNALIVLSLVVLSTGSKLGGTLAACHYLKIPMNQGVFLGFVLNLKGHADLLLIGGASKTIANTDPRAYNLLLITIVINTIISGPVVAVLMRKEEKLFAHTRTTLEYESPENELRTLSCVYAPRHVPSVIAVLSALCGTGTAPVTPYLIHLIELLQKRRNNLSYHELQQDELSDDEGYGGNDVLEIYDAVDNFIQESKVFVFLSKAVSSFDNLYEDVCNVAEDLRVANIILPFHKHQRIDGKMESGKEGIRVTNQKILRHAPCSVGIIVNRRKSAALDFSQLLVTTGSVQHVAVLFFSGPDDREAVAWCTRFISHQRINLTIIRFLPELSSSSTGRKSEATVEENRAGLVPEHGVLMALQSIGTGTNTEIDNAFLADFYNRYVSTGQVGYVEKFVTNGEDTVIALRGILDMYSLFVVGKGGRGHCPLTTGMSDWEECPELGNVGDLLASAEFNVNSSVLVVHQHRHSKKELVDD